MLSDLAGAIWLVHLHAGQTDARILWLAARGWRNVPAALERGVRMP